MGIVVGALEDLPADFKMTELGPLPENWEVVRLGEVASIHYGKARPNSSGRVPLVGSGGIYGFVGDSLVHDPTLIIGRKGTAGQVWLMEKPCWPSDTTFYLTLKNPIDVLFLYNFFLLKPLSGEHAKTTLPSLLRSDLDNYLIPLPPLSEQRAIAHVLRTVQRAQEATEQVIAAARELKKSLMRHLFTYGPVPIDAAARVPLKETEIGLLPEHWEVVRLGEVALIKGGKRLPKGHTFYHYPTPYPYIRIVDLKNESIDRTTIKFLSPNDYEILKQYTISSNDVYISIAGTIGLVGTIPSELDGANLTENAAKIVLKDQKKLNKHFLVYFLLDESGHKQILLRTTKTSQPKLALVRIKQIPIPLPVLREQQEISHILESVDLKIEAEEARLQALSTLFQTLLHHLMTGQVRMADLTIPQPEEVR